MHKSLYHKIWLLRKINPNKAMLYVNWDNILFKFAKNLERIEKYEVSNKCELPHLKLLNYYFANNVSDANITSGTEFIHKEYRYIVNEIITVEFRHFNLEVVKIFKDDELNDINNNKRSSRCSLPDTSQYPLPSASQYPLTNNIHYPLTNTIQYSLTNLPKVYKLAGRIQLNPDDCPLPSDDTFSTMSDDFSDIMDMDE
jgi:hypothetical protein